MSNEFDDLDLDMNQPEPTPRSRRQVVPGQLYVLVALLLAGACAYLAWLHNEDQTAIQRLQGLMQKTQEQRTQLIKSSKTVREALTELADHAVNEAELHRSQRSRKQALADLDRAQKLLGLAENLKTCSCPSETEPVRAVQNKLDKLIADRQPTEQDLSEIVPTEGTSSEQADSASAEGKSDNAQPEQPNKSGENNSGGEPDA